MILEGQALEKALLDQKKVKDKSQSICVSEEEEDGNIYENNSEKLAEILERKMAKLESKIKLQEEEHQRLLREQSIVKRQLVKSEKENKELENSYKNAKNLKEMSDLKTSEDIKSITNTIEDLIKNIKILLSYFNYKSPISESHHNQHLFFSQLDFKSFLMADEELTKLLCQQYDNLLNVNTNNTFGNTTYNETNSGGGVSSSSGSGRCVSSSSGSGFVCGVNVSSGSCIGGLSSSGSIYGSSNSSAGLSSSISSSKYSAFNNSMNSGDYKIRNESQLKNGISLEFELAILEKTLFKTESKYIAEYIKKKVTENNKNQQNTETNIKESFNHPINVEDITTKTSKINEEIDSNKSLEMTQKSQIETLLQEKARLEVELIAAGNYDKILQNQDAILKKYDQLIGNMVIRDALRNIVKGFMMVEMRGCVGVCSGLSAVHQHLGTLSDYLTARNVSFIYFMNE